MEIITGIERQRRWRDEDKLRIVAEAEVSTAVEIRRAHPEEGLALARLWHNGWQDAHAEIFPQALARARTFRNFEDRVAGSLRDIRVAWPRGEPLGMCMLKDDELNQLYVSA